MKRKRIKKQQGVSKVTLNTLKTECLKVLDNLELQPKYAFLKKKDELKPIEVSGRTLRKLFKGEHIHTNTILSIMETFKLNHTINNGLIDIKNEG